MADHLRDATKKMDFISREAAKAKKVYSRERRELVVPVAEIDWLPAADVRPVVSGRWKDAMQSCHDSPHVKCSVCGEYYWRYFNKFNFCPNCGADMREPQMLKNASQNADADVMMPAT